MSRWNHSICDDCWRKREGDRMPIRFRDPEEDVCCFCSKSHKSEIFVRLSPADMPCNGVHRGDA